MTGELVRPKGRECVHIFRVAAAVPCASEVCDCGRARGAPSRVGLDKLFCLLTAAWQ